MKYDEYGNLIYETRCGVYEVFDSMNDFGGMTKVYLCYCNTTACKNRTNEVYDDFIKAVNI